jgi:hypothetical protein
MNKIFVIGAIFVIIMASSVFAGDVIGRHNLSNDRGLVRVKSVEGSKMAVDVIYAPVRGKLVILTDVFADYDSKTQKAVYSEDRLCPYALRMRFQNNGKVVLREAACADF